MSTLISLTGGSGFELKGTNYLSVLAQGTPSENGQAVKDAYTFAQTMTPNGAGLGQQNRVVILLAPGLYSFDEASNGQFILNTSFIDFESLSGERDVYFSSIEVLSSGTGLNVRLSGIDTTVNSYYAHGAFAVSTTGGAQEFITVNNCKGNTFSFSSFSSGFNGEYNNCEGSNYSFGSTGNDFVPPSGITGIPTAFLGFNNFGGTFKNCIGGGYSFCTSSIFFTPISNWGTIQNCQALGNSFCYGVGATVENGGEITNCITYFGGNSFIVTESSDVGIQAINTGSVLNCVSQNNSFVVHFGNWDSSSAAVNVGTISNCLSQGGSVVVNPIYSIGGNYGNILNCTATGSNCFMGRSGENHNIISNCVSQGFSFCSDNPLGIYDDILRCTLTGGTFTVGATSGGRVVLGIDSTGVVNY
jgi:hypothetical protein